MNPELEKSGLQQPCPEQPGAARRSPADVFIPSWSAALDLAITSPQRLDAPQKQSPHPGPRPKRTRGTNGPTSTRPKTAPRRVSNSVRLLASHRADGAPRRCARSKPSPRPMPLGLTKMLAPSLLWSSSIYALLSVGRTPAQCSAGDATPAPSPARSVPTPQPSSKRLRIKASVHR